jgi:hypothetical protein
MKLEHILLAVLHAFLLYKLIHDSTIRYYFVADKGGIITSTNIPGALGLNVNEYNIGTGHQWYTISEFRTGIVVKTNIPGLLGKNIGGASADVVVRY